MRVDFALRSASPADEPFSWWGESFGPSCTSNCHNLQFGSSVYAALKRCGSGFRPREAELNYNRPGTGKAIFKLHQELVTAEAGNLVFDYSLSEADIQVAQVKLTVCERMSDST
jgi:hypothetical protein